MSRNETSPLTLLEDPGMRENDVQGIYKRINRVFTDRRHLSNLASKDTNWLGEEVDIVVKGMLEQIKRMG